MLKKALVFSLLLITAIFSAAALKDTSGEYVYYRDYSFTRESYIGFLYYDDSTYRVRYYAPATEKLTEKTADILFSVSSAKNRIELTGERFVIPPAQEDTGLINYIHDLLYELSARHIKAAENVSDKENFAVIDYSKSKTNFMDTGLQISDDYEQFGGKVTMIYDAVVPIFNLKKILDYAGKDIFIAITTGCLQDSNDTSFSSFKGFSFRSNSYEAPIIKSSDKVELEYTVQINKRQNFTQKVKADKNWALASQNMWTLGDTAFISLAGFRSQESLQSVQIIRRYIASNSYAYSDWTNANIYVHGNTIKISSRLENQRNGNLVTDIKTITKIADNFFGCFSLTIFTADYLKNRGYFDTISKNYSYKIK